ncbi:hypothetical protein CONLIGDRAFT_673175 [Coniochaeta ligniaria NRRL 30616]|uniref:C2H2-type domain-containing protein n=1 Tax=Coniochaeta ligniaria NRRL 30616 TaxID=1408157 RepID=A0A1J7ICC5_9PEZI|nr:hypothetical protein CONLIGDRAFT_673175 [Coniochaeta ligniaria NRRL 30616]
MPNNPYQQQQQQPVYPAYQQSPLTPEQPMPLSEGEQPTRVGRSQGRRDVLPAPTAGTGATHLKRHLFRHIDYRPYLCTLCRATFSRSDILKRHFKNCSIRRGNPTGASHLSLPRSPTSKNAQQQQEQQQIVTGNIDPQLVNWVEMLFQAGAHSTSG